MARTHSFSKQDERSKLETPWGVFEVGKANKRLLRALAPIEKELVEAQESNDLEKIVELTLNLIELGVVDGETLGEHLRTGWDDGSIGVDELTGTAEFLSEELFGAAEKND